MKTRKLKKELERLGIDDSNINIGGSVSYDGCHNLLQRQDGTWEYFYCENSQKAGQKIFDKEDDAAAYFLDVVTKQSQKNGAKRKKKILRPHEGILPFQYYFILGLFIFSSLFGLFFVIILPVTHNMDWMFGFFIGWTIIYAFLAYFWANQKRYWKFEYIAIPIIFTLLSLGCIAIMVFAFISYWHDIFCGIDVISNIIALIAVEGCFGAMAWAFFHFFVQEYVERFIDNLKDRKKKKSQNDIKPVTVRIRKADKKK